MWWKQIVINAVLGALLTLKLSAFAPSLNFVEYFWGLALFVCFAATYNSEADSWHNSKECWSHYTRLGDLVDNIECRAILVPLYLYVLVALCVALAVLQLILVGLIYSVKTLWNCCFRKERR